MGLQSQRQSAVGPKFADCIARTYSDSKLFTFYDLHRRQHQFDDTTDARQLFGKPWRAVEAGCLRQIRRELRL